MSFDIFLAFQRCFPSARPLSEDSDTPCRPLLCQASLVIHEIYTREVRTRSFDLIITFFHHPFSDISETCGPRLLVELFSCATQLLMWLAVMFQFSTRSYGNKWTCYLTFCSYVTPILCCRIKKKRALENSRTSGQSGGRRLLWDFREAASVQTRTLTLLLLRGRRSWSLHAALRFPSRPGEAKETRFGKTFDLEWSN